MSMVFVAGNLALDFVGTLSERRHDRVEGLRAPGDLAGWFVSARLVDEPPDVSSAQLTAAKELREVLYRVVVDLIDGRPVSDRDRELVNTWAARPQPVTVLEPGGRRRRLGAADACLAAVAAAGIDLFDRDDGALVRWCADERCTHPFLDRSRNKQRRWCDMATCGDRAKVRAYRSRRAVSG